MVRNAVAVGDYSSSSEVIREALRDWKEKRALREHTIAELRKAIEEGIQSGRAEEWNVESFLKQAHRRFDERRKA